MLVPLSPVRQLQSGWSRAGHTGTGWISAFSPVLPETNRGNVLEQELSEWIFEESFVEEMICGICIQCHPFPLSTQRRDLIAAFMYHSSSFCFMGIHSFG